MPAKRESEETMQERRQGNVLNYEGNIANR